LIDARSSDKTSLFEQEHEWALLNGCGVDERSLSEPAVIPELEPLEVMRSLLDVILVSAMLEEKLLVTEERGSSLGAGHQPSDVALFATKLGRGVVGENLEHGGVWLNDSKLIVEVVLVGISPAVHIVGLDVDLEGPVMVLNLLTVLIELGQLHDGHGAGKVRHFSQMLTDSLSGTGVVHFSEDVGPSVAEEVERGLTVEGEHSEPVSGGHTVSEELHSVAWGGLGVLRSSEGEL